jgi:FAD/FMN-containing dehydrogenase
MAKTPPDELLARLQERLGPRGFTCDPGDMDPWLTDWRGRYRGRSAALLSPASTAEVQAIVSLCTEARVPLVPQGGNTSMVGGATPPESGEGLLLSLRRMRSIRGLSAEDNVMVAEAGAVLSDIHDAALAIGRRFPLSLGAKGSATIGGLVSTNAGGTQVLRHGTMRALVLGLEAVLADGSLYEGLSALRKDNRGYDLRQLLIGAEGTLGIVTAASLRLAPVPGSTAVAWVGLASPADALRLLRHLEERIGETIESFELVPANALRLVLHHIPAAKAPLQSEHSWNVLVEAAAPPGGTPAQEALGGALGAALEAGLASGAVLAASEAQGQALWALRESIAEAERREGPALKHDIAIPVSKMPGFIEEARAAVEARFPGARVIAFGHLGDGNVHFNVQPPQVAEASAWIEREGEAVTAFVYEMVSGSDGSISAEHGIGQMKRTDLTRWASPVQLAAQRAIKAALDSHGIMNPGKLLLPE